MIHKRLLCRLIEQVPPCLQGRRAQSIYYTSDRAVGRNRSIAQFWSRALCGTRTARQHFPLVFPPNSPPRALARKLLIRPLRCAEQLFDLLEPSRAEQKALHLCAAERAYLLELGHRLDAFGRRHDAEIFRKACDREHDRHRIVPVRESADEAAVDLDLVEGEAAQIAQ